MVILLTQPALLLIDFGHFQYNSVMLGQFSVGHFESVIIDRSFCDSINAPECKLHVQGTGPGRCGFLRRKSWLQADGFVLRAGGRVVLACQVHLSRSEERARRSLLFPPLLFVMLIQKPHAGVECSYSSAL